jgi:hypothetical protein
VERSLIYTIALSVVTIAAVIVILMDLLVWRPY